MNDLIKSIRVGAVDFFGIIIPGILLITMCTLGFFMPLLLVITNISGISLSAGIDWQGILSKNAPLILSALIFALIVFSYVLGYILRLSSPDELDKKSAKKVIDKEKRVISNFEDDCWPYNPDDKTEKYPYSRFRDYLKKRGHLELIEELVTWCPDKDFEEGAVWDDVKRDDGIPVLKTKRSKSAINEMKMKVRIQCPELSALIDSKEGHIRLMAGTWTAFNLSLWLVGIAELIITISPIIYPSLRWCWMFSFVNINLLGSCFIQTIGL